MKNLLTLVLLVLTLSFAVSAQEEPHPHEYAKLRKVKLNLENWTYKNVLTEEEVNLREFSKDKKLVMVFYYAPWCTNSKYQLPVMKNLLAKYQDKGFDIIGVSLYSSAKRVKRGIEEDKINFPVVAESLSSKERKETLHYKYRRKTGDKRKWGTPWNVFLPTNKLKKAGNLLIKKAFVVNGELREREVETFIRKKLGLDN